MWKKASRGSGSSAENSSSEEKPACLKVWVAEWVREVLTEELRNLVAAIYCGF